jgi:DNA helicase-2/ATP-dependent DNA helicase PcrA
MNDSQWQAVCHEGGHLLIVAGPGTGKTHTLTHRIARISRGGSRTAPTLDEQILAITFTNKAAEEMQERLNQRLAGAPAKVFVGTFHRFCLRLLREHIAETGLPGDFTIATDRDLARAARRIWPGSTKRECQDRIEAIARWKAQCFSQEAPEEVLSYNRILRADGLLDYEDLLLEAMRLLSGAPEIYYPFVFVDEYQDINALQHALLKEFVRKGAFLTAIGDPNQAIYGFRGADPRFFESFRQDFPGASVLFLSDNYRSAPNLLKASGQIMAKAGPLFVPQLTAKIYAQRRLTVHEAPTDKAEAEYVVHKIEQMVGGTSLFSHDSGRVDTAQEGERTFRDIAILYRMNAQRHLFEEALSRHGIPCQTCDDRPFVELPPIPESMALLKALRGTGTLQEAMDKLSRTAAGEKIFKDNRPGWQKNVGRFLRMAERFTAVEEFLDYLALQRPEDAVDRRAEYVRLLTLHASKGLEFPVVFITGCEENLLPLRLDRSCPKIVKSLSFPHALSGKPDETITGCPIKTFGHDNFGIGFKIACDPQEERRLFYVGMTRAKEVLFLTHARRRHLWGRPLSSPPSPYLEDIEHQLKEYTCAPSRPRQGRKKESTQMELFEA